MYISVGTCIVKTCDSLRKNTIYNIYEPQLPCPALLPCATSDPSIVSDGSFRVVELSGFVKKSSSEFRTTTKNFEIQNSLVVNR